MSILIYKKLYIFFSPFRQNRKKTPRSARFLRYRLKANVSAAMPIPTRATMRLFELPFLL